MRSTTTSIAWRRTTSARGAWRAGLAELPGIAVDADRVETNIVIFDVRGTGLTGEEFGRRAERFGVRFTVLGPTLVRAVFHLDVPADGVERALSAARAALRG